MGRGRLPGTHARGLYTPRRGAPLVWLRPVQHVISFEWNIGGD